METSPSTPPHRSSSSSSAAATCKQPLYYCHNSDEDPNILIHQFVKRQKELLDLELVWEEEEEEEETNNTTHKKAKGREEEEEEGRTSAVHSLHNLQVLDISTGLYGRTLLTLQSAAATASSSSTTKTSKLLPAHKLSVGDEVTIVNSNTTTTNVNRTKGIPGVIHKITDCTISVAFHDTANTNTATTSQDGEDILTTDSLLLSHNLSVIPSSSINIHNKMKATLDELLQHGLNHPIAHSIVQKMFTNSTSTTTDTTSNYYYHNNFFNPNLDHSQRQAIQFALTSNDVALIHGPPGTGKTTAVVELIQQAVIYNQWKVLLCAASNIAVDNVLERLVSSSSSSSHKNRKIQAVRLGHPARISNTKAMEHSLEALVTAAHGTEIVNDCKKELTQYVKKMLSYNNKNTTTTAQQRKKMKLEIKSLRKEIRSREEKIVNELVRGANVICSTNVGASMIKKKFTNNIVFDLVIIDEAAQALEVSCWIPALCGKRLVLVGDHRQLPPTIQSPKASSELGFTMFDRAMAIYDRNTISRMLTVQYRMHKDISDWSSKAMYQGKLVPADSVAQWKLKDLPYVITTRNDDTDDNELIHTTLLLIDTAGCDMEESVLSSGSRFNEGEALLVQNHVERLLQTGLRESDIAIITPYNGQVEILRSMLLLTYPKLEIRSVDGFQGCEKEAVVLSLVRSNTKGEVGFLADDRRLNVAVTRARKQCTIICNTETVSRHRFIKNLIQWFEDFGDYRSALEFIKPTTASSSSSASISKSNDTDRTSEKPTPAEITALQRKQDSKNSIVTNYVDKLTLTDCNREQTLIGDFSKTDQTHHNVPPNLEVLTEPLQDGSCTYHGDLENPSTSNVKSDDTRIEPTSPKSLSRTAQEEQVQNSKLEEDSSIVSDEDSNEENVDSVAIDDFETRSLTRTMDQNNAKNQLLADLTQERMQRKRAEVEEQRKSVVAAVQTSSKKKTTQSKGKRLGGEPKSQMAAKGGNQTTLDEDALLLDDMEFLDKQIAEVQSSHGRKIEGTGSSYRTIVNGILLTRPPANKTITTTKESRAASQALKEKLRQAEERRKVKTKKGK